MEDQNENEDPSGSLTLAQIAERLNLLLDQAKCEVELARAEHLKAESYFISSCAARDKVRVKVEAVKYLLGER